MEEAITKKQQDKQDPTFFRRLATAIIVAFSANATAQTDAGDEPFIEEVNASDFLRPEEIRCIFV